MIRFFKITTWIVICLSGTFMLFTLFAIVAVGAAGHSSGSSFDTGMACMYLTALPVSLILIQSITYKNRLTTFLAGCLLFVGILFCLYGLYDNYRKGYGRTEYLLAGVPLSLLLIVFIGLLRKKI